MTMTDHGLLRIKERAGIGKSQKKAARLIENAFRRGYKIEETKGLLRIFLNEKYFTYEAGNNLRLYGGKLYVFEDDRLITVYAIPGSIQKDIRSYIAS